MARESTIGTTFHLETLPRAAGATITSVTKAANAVVSATGTYAIGDLVAISGTGMKSIDRKTAHRVIGQAVGTFTIDTDTTDEAAAATAGSAAVLTLAEVPLSEFGLDVPAPNDVDVTTMSDTERRNVSGLPNIGSASFGGPLDMTNTGVVLLIEASRDGVARQMSWKTRGGQVGLLYGVVTSFSAGPQGVEQAVTFTGTFQVQDSPLYFAPTE